MSDHVVALKIVTLPPLPPDRSEDCICCAVNRRCKAKREVQAKWSNDLFLDALLCRWRVLPSYKKIDLGCIRLHPEYLLHKNCIHACTSHLYVCICKSKHKINSTTTQCKLHLATPLINSLQERRHITYSSQESQLSRWWGCSCPWNTLWSSPRPCCRTRTSSITYAWFFASGARERRERISSVMVRCWWCVQSIQQQQAVRLGG